MQANYRKDEFVVVLAHELRNPLAVVSASSELLSRASADETLVKKTTSVLARQVGQMTGLVDDLLDVSRVTRGLLVFDEVLLAFPWQAHGALATGKQLDHGLFDKCFGIFLLHCCLYF